MAQDKEDRVTKIVLQPRFELQPSFKKNGKTFRKIEYVADFEVTFADGAIRIYDCKGMRTEIYKLKQKLFEFKYPNLEIIET